MSGQDLHRAADQVAEGLIVAHAGNAPMMARATAPFQGLPELVAYQEGLFAKEGLDIEWADREAGVEKKVETHVTTPKGVTPYASHGKLFEQGKADMYNACEWGNYCRVQDTGQGSRPNTGTCSGRLSDPSASQWYDPSCFAVPAPYTYGNLGRNTLRADGTRNIDLGLYKDFSPSEKYRIQFRGEFFNALNHPTLGVPDNYVNDGSSAGAIYSASDPRIIQVALKIYF